MNVRQWIARAVFGIGALAWWLSPEGAMPAAAQATDSATEVDAAHPVRRVGCPIRSLHLRPTESSPRLGAAFSEDFPLVLGHVKGSFYGWLRGAWRIYSARNDEIGFIEDGSDCRLFDAYLIAIEDARAELPRLEQAHAASEAEVLGDMPWVLTGVKPSQPDTAGGVDLQIGFINRDSERAIKYLTVEVTPYDQVGEPVTGSVRGHSRTPFRVTGPIEASDGEQWALFTNAWYHSPGISCARIDKVELETMDGERAVYVRDLPQILAPWLGNDCTFTRQKRPYSWPDLAASAEAHGQMEERRKGRFVAEGDIVRDAALGVAWTRSGPDLAVREATDHCATRGPGWRLPNQREAEAIYFPTLAESDNEELAMVEYKGGHTSRIRLYAAFEPTGDCVWARTSASALGALEGLTGEFELRPKSFTTCDALCLAPPP